MPRFLFWNLEGKEVQHLVAQLAEEHSVDLIVLSECETPAATMLMQLNAAHVRYEFCPGLCDGVTFFGAFQANFLTPVSESARVSIRRLKLPARNEILVAAAHLPSRLHFSSESMTFECSNLAGMIKDQEEESGHQRTIVLGDLNVNPFEIGMVGTGGLHAVMSREVASRGSRTFSQGNMISFIIRCGRTLVTGTADRRGRIIMTRPSMSLISGTCSIRYWFVRPCLKGLVRKACAFSPQSEGFRCSDRTGGLTGPSRPTICPC